MNKIATILLSLIILLGIGLLSLFAFNKHQETEIEKEKIKLELAKLESKEKNKKADAKQDKKTQANESKASEKTPEDKVADNNLNKTAAECILPRNLSAACHNFSSNPIVAIYFPPLYYPLHKYSKYLDIMWGFLGFLYKKVLFNILCRYN